MKGEGRARLYTAYGNGGSGDGNKSEILEYARVTSVILGQAIGLNIPKHDMSTNFSFRFNSEGIKSYVNYGDNSYLTWGFPELADQSDSKLTNTLSLQDILLGCVFEFGNYLEYGFSEFDEYHIVEDISLNTRVFGPLKLVEGL